MKEHNLHNNQHNEESLATETNSVHQNDCKHLKKTDKSKEKSQNQSNGMSKATIWTIKITIVTLVLAFFFSFISEITSTYAHVSITIILLILLIAISIVCDTIGVAATSCDLAPLLAMASRKVKGSKKAIALVKNAEKVSNICCDVIGDICGIISGACTVAIVIKLSQDNETLNYWLSILTSSIVSAVIVGGKSFFKTVAMNNSREILLFVSRALGIFSRKEK